MTVPSVARRAWPRPAGARSAKVHLTRGALAARAGDGAAAAAAFHQALAIHPGSPPGLHTHRALVGGRVPAALRPADAVASHAGYEDALYSLGRLTMEAGVITAPELGCTTGSRPAGGLLLRAIDM